MSEMNELNEQNKQNKENTIDILVSPKKKNLILEELIKKLESDV